MQVEVEMEGVGWEGGGGMSEGGLRAEADVAGEIDEDADRSANERRFLEGRGAEGSCRDEVPDDDKASSSCTRLWRCLT